MNTPESKDSLSLSLFVGGDSPDAKPTGVLAYGSILPPLAIASAPSPHLRWKVLNITASVKNKDGRECLVQVVQHGNKYSFVVTSSGEKLIEGNSQPELTFGLPNQAIKAGLEELKRKFS